MSLYLSHLLCVVGVDSSINLSEFLEQFLFLTHVTAYTRRTYMNKI